MAKVKLFITDDFADVVTKFNGLSDDLGDLTLLSDSANDVVTAINYRDSDFASFNQALANVLAISNAADSDQNVVIDGKANIGHTHVEADITNLDKYTQAQVNALLAGKENVNANILRTTDIGTTVQAYDANTLKTSAIGVTVQAYDANTLKTSAIGTTVQPFNAQNAVRNVNNNFSFRQVIESNPGVASTYTTGQLELRAPGAQDVTLGFNRNGNSGAQLRHTGNGLVLSGNTRTASADFQVTGDFSIVSDRRTKKGIVGSSYGLETVCKLRGVEYIKADTDTRHVGFIAQEVLEALPEAVNTEGEFMSVSDRPIIAALVEAIKELAQQVEDLKRGN